MTWSGKELCLAKNGLLGNGGSKLVLVNLKQGPIRSALLTGLKHEEHCGNFSYGFWNLSPGRNNIRTLVCQKQKMYSRSQYLQTIIVQIIKYWH